MITGAPFTPFQQRFTVRGPQRIGSRSKKALYQEYTDATFHTLKPRAASDAYLGFLGPIIRAEVGDTIRVVFRNNATHPYSMHRHGVFYEKESEGGALSGRYHIRAERKRGQTGRDLHLYMDRVGEVRTILHGRKLRSMDVPLARQRERRR